MNLAFLPPEILAQVFNNAHHSYLLLDLWKTGDRLLLSKLQSSITHVHLEQVTSTPFAIPPLLSNFRALRSLSLSSQQKLRKRHVSKWQAVLRTLSPTLESISIECSSFRSGAEKAFLNYGSDYQYPSALTLTDYGRGPSPWIDLASIFPFLTRIELFPCQLTEFELAGLPSTLRELKASTVRLDSNSSLMSLLPRSLERFEVKTEWTALTISDWRNAPPHLEYASHIKTAGSDAIQFADWLPSNLAIGHLDFSSTDWTSAVLGHLPTTVSQLTINSVRANTFNSQSTNWLAAVPRSVTFLRIERWTATVHTSDPIISYLPPNLAKLQVDGYFRLIVDEGVNVASLWPSSLTSLIVGESWFPMDMKMLPQSLTQLHVCFTNLKHVELVASDFPPKIEHVYLDSSTDSFKLDIIGTFPASLTTFGPSLGSHGVGTELQRRTIEKSLPSTLSSLAFSMHRSLPPNDRPWIFPHHLTSLRVTKWSIQWLESLPQSLISLSIFDLRDLPSAPTVGPFDLFRPFPKSLRWLKFHAFPEVSEFQLDISTGSLASLTHLRQLMCAGSLKIPSHVFRHVPKSLRSLHVGLSSVDQEDLAFCPSWLHYVIAPPLRWHNRETLKFIIEPSNRIKK